MRTPRYLLAERECTQRCTTLERPVQNTMSAGAEDDASTKYDKAFHTGETCAEYDERRGREHDAENDASTKKIQSTTKKIPLNFLVVEGVLVCYIDLVSV
jgi:hypothetical protein